MGIIKEEKRKKKKKQSILLHDDVSLSVFVDRLVIEEQTKKRGAFFYERSKLPSLFDYEKLRRTEGHASTMSREKGQSGERREMIIQ